MDAGGKPGWLVWTLLAAILALIALAAVVRIQAYRPFHPDSVSYLSAAESLAGFHGYASRIDFGGSSGENVRLPEPVTSWPPAYSLVVSRLTTLGVPVVPTGYAVSVFAHLLVVLITFIILLRRHAPAPALIGAALVGLTPALFRSATYPLSESLFVAFVALTLAGVAPRDGELNMPSIPAGGIFAGLATLTRYVGFALPLGIVPWILVQRAPVRTRIRAAIEFTAPWLFITATCLAMNIARGGTPFGDRYIALTNPIRTVARILAASAAGIANVAEVTRPSVGDEKWVGLAILIVGATILYLFRRNLLTYLRTPPGQLYAATSAAFVLVLFAARSTIAFDTIGPRFVTPIVFLVALMIVDAYLPEGVLRPAAGATLGAIIGALLILYAAFPVARLASSPASEPPVPSESAFIARHLNEDEIVLVFWSNRVNCYFPNYVVPLPSPLTEATLKKIVLAAGDAELPRYTVERLRQYRDIVLVIPTIETMKEIPEDLGPFVRKLAAGSYPPWLEPTFTDVDGFTACEYIPPRRLP